MKYVSSVWINVDLFKWISSQNDSKTESDNKNENNRIINIEIGMAFFCFQKYYLFIERLNGHKYNENLKYLNNDT